MSKSKSKAKKPVVNPFKVRRGPSASTLERVKRQLKRELESPQMAAAIRGPVPGMNAAAEEAREILMRLAEVKPLYKRLEELTDALLNEALTRGVDLSAYGIVLVDNYAEKSTAWKSVSFRRFELKVTR